MAVGAHVNTVDPHHASTFAEIVVAQTLHQGLVGYDSAGDVAPGLAESWSVSEDGRTYTFVLKSNLTWSDTTPLTAGHIVAGFLRALDPVRPSPFAERLYGVKNAESYQYRSFKEGDSLGVEAPDLKTVVIRLDRRDVGFLDTLAHPVAVPFPDDGTAGTRSDWVSGRLTSGAYRVLARPENAEMTLEGVQGGPSLDIHVVQSTQDAAALVAKSEGFVTAALPMVTSPQMGARANWVRADQSHSLYAYGVNMGRAPFNTIEARHALAMAINRAALLDVLPPDMGMKADQLVAPSVMGALESYKAPFAPLTFEEREAVASALLAEQGFGRDNPLNVILRIPEGDIHRTAANRIASMWAASGIGTDIVESPLPDHWRALERGDYDVAFMAWPGRNDTPLGILEPLSQMGGVWNFPLYAFDGFTERLKRATSHDDDEERLGYYREAEKALIEDQSLIALFFYQPLSMVSPTVRGWQSNASGLHSLSDLSIVSEEPAINLIRPTLPRRTPSLGDLP